MSEWAGKLHRMAEIARSSELHDLKCGLEPTEADEVADALEASAHQYETALNKLERQQALIEALTECYRIQQKTVLTHQGQLACAVCLAIAPNKHDPDCPVAKVERLLSKDNGK